MDSQKPYYLPGQGIVVLDFEILTDSCIFEEVHDFPKEEMSTQCWKTSYENNALDFSLDKEKGLRVSDN